MPIRELLAIAVPVVDALATAHHSGITHRDIKPSNLMIGRDRVTILDFGLAKRDQEQNGRTLLGDVADTGTHSGTIMGTLAYTAPEVIQGREPEPLCASRPDMPASLGRVVGRCLEKDPARRHGDTRDLLRELQMLSGAI